MGVGAITLHPVPSGQTHRTTAALLERQKIIINLGFTLIEILMAMVITAIIATIAIPQFIDFTDGAKTSVTQSRLNDLKAAIVGDPRIIASGGYSQVGFFGNLGSLPTSLNDLANQGAYATYDPFTKRGWRGPYVNTSVANWNQDGWGTTFVYNSGTRTITSCGPDKTCSTADDIQITF